MKEKILALLIAKFSGVRKDGLAQLAASVSLQIEKEEDATAFIEKLTAEKVDAFVKDWRIDVDKEVSVANKTHETNLKKKFDFVDKKSDGEDPGKNSQSKTNDDEEAPSWAKKIIDQNKTLADKITAFESEKVSGTRLQQLEAKFKEVPDAYKAQRIADAKLFIGTMDDAAFAEYLARTETDVTAFNQELANKGLAGHGKPMFGKTGNDGVSAGVNSYIATKEDKNNPLTGKEV